VNERWYLDPTVQREIEPGAINPLGFLVQESGLEACFQETLEGIAARSPLPASPPP
jgi:hypothetical protein